MRDLYWTLGQYDAVTIIEAPDDMTATALALSLGKLGNVRKVLREVGSCDVRLLVVDNCSS